MSLRRARTQNRSGREKSKRTPGGRILQRIIAALGVGVLATIGLTAAPSAAVAAVNDKIVVGDITLNPAGAQLTIGDKVTVAGSWSAVDADPKEGDTFTIGLPPEFTFPAAVPFRLLGPDNVVWGNCLTDPSSGIASCELTDAVVEKPELVQGAWEFEVQAVKETTATEVTFDLNGDKVTVPLPGGGGIDDGIDLPGTMTKVGAMNGNNWSMNWTVELPGANMAGQESVRLTDTFGPGHVLCDPVGLKVQTVRGSTVVDVTSIATIDGAPGDAGFDLVLTAPHGGFSTDVTYRVTYQTCTPGGQIGPAGTKYVNSAQVEGWGDAGLGVGEVTNGGWHQSLAKSGSVLGGADRNGKIAWTVVIPGDELVNQESFSFSEVLGDGHELCTSTIGDLKIVEQYGPNPGGAAGLRQDITGKLTRAEVKAATERSFDLQFTINDADFDFKASDWRYVVTYTTCVSSTDLPASGTSYTNTVTVDGKATGAEAKVPGRSQGKSGRLNGAFVTLDGVTHMPQTTMSWNVTIPGEKVDGIAGPLKLTDTLSLSQMICEAGDPTAGIAERMNLRAFAKDQISGGKLDDVELTKTTTVSLDGQQITFEIAPPNLRTPTGTSDGFTREYQYTLSYTTCTTSGGMDAPGTVYGNKLEGHGIAFSSSVTQSNKGSGTGTGVTRGSVSVSKSLADTPGADLIPAGTAFTVRAQEFDPTGAAQAEYELSVPLNGDPVSGFNARGKGWTIRLSEPTLPKVHGVTWGTPVFKKTDGVTPSPDGTTAVAALTPGSNIAVSLENRALLGSATVTKNLTGPEAALALVGPDKNYRITAKIDTSRLGNNVPAQADRVFDLKAGETETLENLPIGAVVTLSEAGPADDDTLTWSAPQISPNPITIEPGHATTPAAVTVTNRVDRTVGTFSIAKNVTGAQADNPAVPGSVFVTATWTQDGKVERKVLTVPTDGTPVALGENLLIGTKVTLTETALVDGSSIAWASPVWSGTGVTVDGDSAVVSITRTADARVVLENHAATSVAGISLIKGIAGAAAGEVPTEAEFPITATWTDADGEKQSKKLMINAVEPTLLGVQLPAGTVVTITEGERPELDKVIWGSITISGTDVTDNGDGSAEIVVSDQQDDVTLVTVVNEATWAPGTFTISKKVTGILLENPDIPEAVTVMASWLEGTEPRSAEVIIPIDGTPVAFGRDLPHETLVTLSELPLEDAPAFTWSTPVFTGDDLEAHEDGTASLTIGAAKDAGIVVTNEAVARLGALTVTKELSGSGASLVDDTAFPVTATWTDLLGETQSVEIEVRAGEATVIDGLPLGTEVTLSEGDAEVPANARWHGATWSTDDESVALGEVDGNAITLVVTGENGAQAAVTVTNEFEKLPDLAVTGGPIIKASIISLAALLVGAGIVMLVLHRRRQA
ncbi:DUF5979 domain-containing protein [Microbacterium sp.]|uniref:DUF5979 domain-containing protein n=1 Tax=Microbacterium sp. TaxID=51671 RepID=UPI0028AE7CC1|nr:DUF5979 domain-containing protein [Microbacterium sp.]